MPFSDYLWELGHYAWVGKGHGPADEVTYACGSHVQATSIANLPATAEGHRRLVLISDTHEQHRSLKLPPCDILLHCGDALLINRHFSVQYSTGKITELGAWLSEQAALKVLHVAGNHDHAFEALGRDQVQALLGDGVHYLQDDSVDVLGLKIFASPWSDGRSENSAFQQEGLSVPKCAFDILMTHGPPPKHILKEVGPRLAVCGHIHERYGVKNCNGSSFVNCSIMDGRYNASHRPIVFDIAIASKAGS